MTDKCDEFGRPLRDAFTYNYEDMSDDDLYEATINEPRQDAYDSHNLEKEFERRNMNMYEEDEQFSDL